MKGKLFNTLAFILTSVLLSAQTNFVEDFDLNFGSLNNQNQWQGNTGFQVVSDPMTLADYPLDNAEAKVLRVQSTGGNIERGSLLPLNFATGAAYLSFLVRIENQGELPGAPALQLGLEKAAFTTAFAGFGFYENATTGGIEASLTTQSALDEVVTNGGGFAVGTVYHVVLKYEFLPAANDALSVYLSPTFMPTEPAVPLLQTTVNGTGVADEIGRLLIDAPPGSNNVLSVDGIQFGNAWNGTFDAGLLPVELADFRAELSGDRVELTWRTLTETNNELFHIERSTDGRLFTKIGKVSGFGNSQQVITYRYTDFTPPSGTVYYRLQQKDYSGATTYSEIVSVVNRRSVLSIHLYPNPTSDYLRVAFAPSFTPLSLWVRRGDGGIIPVTFTPGADAIMIDVRNLPAGTYWIELLTAIRERVAYAFIVQGR